MRSMRSLLSWKLTFGFIFTAAFSFICICEQVRKLRLKVYVGKLEFQGRLLSGIPERDAPPYAVFYSIDVREDDSEIFLVAILREQLSQLAASSAAASRAEHPLTVYYNTIGNTTGAARVIEQVNALCRQNSLQCTHTEHNEQVSEISTLQKLYDYCQTNESHQVAYIHNRESDRPWPELRPWRYHGTRAVAHDLCRLGDGTKSSGECNLCGLLWNPFPSLHVPGNHWTAQCSYIKRLVPPIGFQERMERYVNQTAVPMISSGKLKSRMYDDLVEVKKEIDVVMGTDQFSSAEQWVASHPSAKPCGLSPSPNITYWSGDDGGQAEFVLSPLDRSFTFRAAWGTGPARLAQIIQRRRYRCFEYHMLPGLLLKWKVLYGEIPPESSWVWRYYPDGMAWKEESIEDGFDIEKLMMNGGSPRCLASADAKSRSIRQHKDFLALRRRQKRDNAARKEQ